MPSVDAERAPVASGAHGGQRPRAAVALWFALASGLSVAFSTGCTAIRPVPLSGGPVVAYRPFSHESFASVLERFVDDAGQVDYAGLRADPIGLERYYYLLSRHSPDNDPGAFPSREDRLAYWLNAYNASVLETVLRYYPLDSVTDVEPPQPLFFLPRESGFFVFQRVRLGEHWTNLHCLERRIRRDFRDPRIHFVLNCASRGCPRLRRQPLAAEHLEGQLDRATRAFIDEERNVRIDHDARVVHLSAIFDWYEGDFLDWWRAEHPDRDATILDYIAAYLPPERAGELERTQGYEVRILPYDWSLNDGSPPAAATPPAEGAPRVPPSGGG